jgi:hypothetical protein
MSSPVSTVLPIDNTSQLRVFKDVTIQFLMPFRYEPFTCRKFQYPDGLGSFLPDFLVFIITQKPLLDFSALAGFEAIPTQASESGRRQGAGWARIV